MKKIISLLVMTEISSVAFGQSESPTYHLKEAFTLNEILTLIAIVFGPIIAIQIQRYLDKTREVKNRKVSIFKTLMASRGATLSASHVEALNRIDLEFSSNKKYKKVIEAWKEYFDNLCVKVDTQDALMNWSVRNEELRANLLYEMGQSLGYNFDKVLIKRNIYAPVGHERNERENELIRKGLLEVLNLEKAIPMTVISDDRLLAEQAKLQKAMLKYYKSKN